ncbi:MAG: MauE/DoxX family redox-associated membrane protein [Syntrophobacterales bacterium]
MGEDRQTVSYLTHPITASVLRIVLGSVFIYASLDKIRHPDLFAEAVYNYQLLPDVTVNLVAILLPWLELLSGSLLVLGLWMEGSILILSGLMVVFIGALGINLARGLDVHCGCFITQSSDPITILTLFRDSLFLLLAFYLLWLYQIRGVEERFSLGRVFRRDSSRLHPS